MWLSAMVRSLCVFNKLGAIMSKESAGNRGSDLQESHQGILGRKDFENLGVPPITNRPTHYPTEPITMPTTSGPQPPPPPTETPKE